MKKLEIFAKKNQDGSFSASVEALSLVEYAFVDFYDEISGKGYQRKEPTREARGRAVAKYIQRCKAQSITPSLFELTGNVRTELAEIKFSPIDPKGQLGLLTIEAEDKVLPISIVDGGTRLLGIENALTSGSLAPTETFDIRLFCGLSIAEEVAQFLLINDTQKKVRTDLSLRVVQRSLDDDKLTDEEKLVLLTVVPPSDAWRYNASRVTGRMNLDSDSPWRGLIQMPGDNATKPLKMQAFFTSLKPFFVHEDLMAHYGRMKDEGAAYNDADVVYKILKNFWAAVKEANPEAYSEPATTVLWGSIGVNACHIALAPILLTIFESGNPDLTTDQFLRMLKNSKVQEYDYWFTKAGGLLSDYPTEKGEATVMTGAANYNRLGRELEKEWRNSLHASREMPVVRI